MLCNVCPSVCPVLIRLHIAYRKLIVEILSLVDTSFQFSGCREIPTDKSLTAVFLNTGGCIEIWAFIELFTYIGRDNDDEVVITSRR